jgi:hypothetical protein
VHLRHREHDPRWRNATLAIVRFLEAKGAGVLDLVDASTLAGMFVEAAVA